MSYYDCVGCVSRTNTTIFFSSIFKDVFLHSVSKGERIADRCAQKTESRNAALLGPTNLDWVVSVFGLSRAGFTILTISPRLSYQAMAKLIEETECKSLIYIPSAQLLPVVDQVKAATTVRTIATISRSEYDRVESSCPMFVREVDVMEEKKRCAAIVHSSGSTGLPKPIYFTHARYTIPYEIGPGDRDFVTLPLSVFSSPDCLHCQIRAMTDDGTQIPQLLIPSVPRAHVSAQDHFLPQFKSTSDVRGSHEWDTGSKTRHSLRGSLCAEATE